MKSLFRVWRKHIPQFVIGTMGVALRNLGIVFLNACFAERILAAFGTYNQVDFKEGWGGITLVIILFCVMDALFLMIHQMTTHDMICDIKHSIYTRIMGAELFNLGKQGEKGSIISHFTSDIELVSECLKYQILTPVMMFISGIGAAASLTIVTGGIVAPSSVLFISGIMVWCQHELGKRIAIYRKDLQKQIAEGTKLTVYMCENEELVLESGQAEKGLYLLGLINEKCRRYDRKVAHLKAMNDMVGEISRIFQYVAGPIIGVWLYASGGIRMSEIVLIGPSMSLLYSFGTSLGNIIVMLKETRVGFEKVSQYLDLEQEKEGGAIDTIDRNKEPLSISELSFAYADGTEVFRNFSSDGFVGNMIGIKGDSGSGKSTFIKILMGLFPYEGSIKLYGNEISMFNRTFLRESISYIPQSGFLLPGGLQNNVIIDPDSTHVLNAKAALKNVGIPDEIIEEDWKAESLNHLSGGEKQRVALARALLSKSKVLILDETFSGIDREERFSLLDIVKGAFSDNLILLVSHDDDLLCRCDSVLKIGGKGNDRAESGAL